jgi:hypothetical protein
LLLPIVISSASGFYTLSVLANCRGALRFDARGTINPKDYIMLLAPHWQTLKTLLERYLPSGTRVCFLHLDGTKKIERATMTRIGHYQIKSRQLCWQCFLAARQSRPVQNFPDQTASPNISGPTVLGCLIGVGRWLCIP